MKNPKPKLSKQAGNAASIQVSTRIARAIERARSNPYEPFTPERLRKRPGLEGLSDAEATQAIATIRELALVFFSCSVPEKTSCIDNQHVVSFGSQNKAA